MKSFTFKDLFIVILLFLVTVLALRPCGGGNSVGGFLGKIARGFLLGEAAPTVVHQPIAALPQANGSGEWGGDGQPLIYMQPPEAGAEASAEHGDAAMVLDNGDGW